MATNLIVIEVGRQGPAGTPVALSNLTDVVAPAPAEGDALKFNALTSVWEPVPDPLAPYTVGDMLYAINTTDLAKLAAAAAGNVLISVGVAHAPAWGKVSLTAHVNGILPVANGGTGEADGWTSAWNPGHLHQSLNYGPRGASSGVSVDFMTGITTVTNSLIIGSPATLGTSAVRVFAMNTGVAPTTSPADKAQMWVADIGGVAGKAGFHIRNEDGSNGPLLLNVVEDTTPQLGGDLDLNNKNIVHSIPATTLTANGNIISATVDINLSGICAPLFMATGGGYQVALATSTTTCPCVAMALETGSGTKKVLLHGLIRNGNWSWIRGKLIYLSTTGTLTQTEPSGRGDIIQILGWAMASNVMMFWPQLDHKTVGDSFTFKIVYDAPGTFTLPIYGGGDGYIHNFTVDWGDGTTSTITSYDDADRVHTYLAAGTYIVKLTGHCEYFGFINAGDKDKVTELISFTGDMGFRLLNFAGCTNLTSMVPLGSMYSLATASTMFAGCTSLTNIPNGFFNGCVNITDFSYVFYECTSLEGVGANDGGTDLFRSSIAATTFASAFAGCSSLVYVDEIFKFNTSVTDFSYVFYACLALTTVPANLFRYNVNVTTFVGAFSTCRALASVPSGLFRYNTEVLNFSYVFYCCDLLASVPTDLFKYNTKVTDFTVAFYDCRKLTQNAYIFFAVGEEGTRFLNQSVDFTQCFRLVHTFTGSQGTAPDLWNCDFGTGTPVKSNCFWGHDGSSLDNYGDIPLLWQS